MTEQEKFSRLVRFIKDYVKANNLEMETDGPRDFLKGKDAAARAFVGFAEEMDDQ